MNPHPLELAQMQAVALYVHDGEGRLLRVNEPDSDETAPRLFLARTAAGSLWRTRYDLPADLVTQLERLAADEPVVSDLRAPPRSLVEYTELLRRHAPIQSIYAGPAYYLPHLGPPTGTVEITPENAALLSTYFPYTRQQLTERAPVVAVVVDGIAVAACYSVRRTAQAIEAGVDTIAGYRGHGYAVETVRGWAAGVRASGRLPLYSTSWENTASQAVAHKLGAILYGVDFQIL